MELIPTILDQLHSEVIVKTALSAAKSERWLEIPFHKLFVLAATGNSGLSAIRKRYQDHLVEKSAFCASGPAQTFSWL